ncbi:GntR family transcriptional regulator [Roseomonas sp. GC11]|uniref:GntR family transcriptional regulator n=1 Tax=Roseomonas sp. GC11 TaxID=2950546 RepID=UPI00210F0B7D|nr:GntR family transcriptional regulator [Roseomonas sp. GC11]MCQ4159017.1 GntR family transcriptional regulator [Roseomonas sp. GC11]
MTALKHRTVSAALLEEIRRRVLDGRYPAGSQLRQDMLAEEFGVSRIPVREALFQLEAEGLVRISPHRGATVAELSPEELEEAFALRALLEPRLLRASAPRLEAEDFTALERLLDDYAAAMRAGDTSRWGELNTALHLRLYARAGQKRTAAMVASLLQECDRYTRLQLSTEPEGLARADREHRELVRLCRAGAVEAAAALLAAHVAHVGQALLAFLRQRGG